MFDGIGLEKLIFQGIGADISCAIIGIGIASFVGKDYANNTIRNKICYGENRYKIVLITFVESVLITLAFIAVSTISSVLFGLIFGAEGISSEFFVKYICQSLILISFSMVITAIVVCTKSTKAGFITTLIVSVLLTAVAYILPPLAAKSTFAEIVCRSLYMIVSNMLISSTDGVYNIGSTFAFEHIYLNVILLFVGYLAVSVGSTLLVVKKQNYK